MKVLLSILIKTSRSGEQINFLSSRLLGFLHYLCCMKREIIIWILPILCLLSSLCHAQPNRIVCGDERMDIYFPLLQGRRIALFTNHTACIEGIHLLDVLRQHQVDVRLVFAPEHGFRGNADAGQLLADDTDAATGLPVRSLYGGAAGSRPLPQDMQRFDVLLVDIQDVGCRFYTYHITLCALMEACSRAGKEVVLLDRPNPNGHYVDGPLLDTARYTSAVGRLPIPVVHGLTLGELARMAVGEGWIEGAHDCHLTVVPCLNYTHSTYVELPIPPSPNLPDAKSIALYPSTCYFEATPVSVGRGTDRPFQLYGHPDMKRDSSTYSFVPRSRTGAKRPPQMDKVCYGTDLGNLPIEEIRSRGINLAYLIDAYRRMVCRADFFSPFFERLIGVDYVRTMITEGREAAEIEAVWRGDVARFKEQRRLYLLYPE